MSTFGLPPGARLPLGTLPSRLSSGVTLKVPRLPFGAVAGLGVLAGVSGAVVALMHQARSASRTIQDAAIAAALADGTLLPTPTPDATEQQRVARHLVNVRLPEADGIHRPDGERISPGHNGDQGMPKPFTLVLLGDSTAVGYGTADAHDLPGAVIARTLARQLHRDVRLATHGLVGALSADLSRQLTLALAEGPDAVVILVGGNDIRERVPPWRAAAQLGAAVAALRAQEIPVVVGTCPDFGVIAPIPQPLRTMVAAWSHRLAALQERAVIDADGHPVPLGRLVSPLFAGRPELFAADRFHPSGPGYRQAADVLARGLIEVLEGSDSATGTAPTARSA